MKSSCVFTYFTWKDKPKVPPTVNLFLLPSEARD